MFDYMNLKMRISYQRTKGQRDKLNVLLRDGTGQDSLSKSGTGRGMGQSLFFRQSPGREAGRD